MIKSFASSASRCSLVVDVNFIYPSDRRSETNNKSRQFGSDCRSAAINFNPIQGQGQGNEPFKVGPFYFHKLSSLPFIMGSDN